MFTVFTPGNKMSLEQTACDESKQFSPGTMSRRLRDSTGVSDLKAFERRLTEVIGCLQPATMRWRILLTVVSVCTAIAAYHWLMDPLTPLVSLTQSLWNHPFFAFTSTFLVLLFMMGVHRKVVAPSIITARTRSVLNDFNMSCDDTGKLILKPRPANT